MDFYWIRRLVLVQQPLKQHKKSLRAARISQLPIYYHHLVGHNRPSFFYSTTQTSLLLQPPTILYEDNHLLVVNKPVGWHSIPNNKNSNSNSNSSNSKKNKCLLSFAKSNQWGGGSQNDFLLPLHRLDQPCSGVLLLGKTKKAATRVTKLWKQKGVIKDYLCVVYTKWLPQLLHASSTTSSSYSHENHHHHSKNTNGWYHLQGVMHPRPSRETRSVVIQSEMPLLLLSKSKSSKSSSSSSSSSSFRPVHVMWKNLPLYDSHDTNRPPSLYSLLQVQTTQGARHMIRALLAQVGNCPIVGDLRYTNSRSSNSKFDILLPDKSVALHAYRVTFDEKRFQLGSLTQFVFEGPIPLTWKLFFNITSESI